MEQEQPKKRNPIPFAKGTPEYHEEVKRRLRENWAAKKHVYRPVGETAERGDAPPAPSRRLAWDTPDDLKDVLGDRLVLDDDWMKWPMFHVRRHGELSKTTLTQYKSAYYKLPQRGIYDVVRVIMTYPLAQRNMFAKAGLSYVCQNLYESIYERQRKSLSVSSFYRGELHRMMVFSELSKRTKRASYEQHSSQAASHERLEATVEWHDWEELAKRFIRALITKKDATERDKQEAMVAAVYSMIPPVRLDWNDIEVRRCKGGATLRAQKGEVGKNILYMAATEAVVFWGEFKNSSSFGDELPLRQELPAALVKVLKKCLSGEESSTPLKVRDFSSFVTNLAEQITGKPFSNRLMRSSYIRWWHETHSNGSVNVDGTKALMRLMHQTNMEVHLAYNKTHTVEPAVNQTES